MDTADIIALIVSIVTACALVYKTITEKHKSDADADKTEADANEVIRKTVMDLIEPMQKKIDTLQAQVNELEAENADLKDWAERLVAQVKSFGCEPAKFTRRKPRGGQ